MDDEVKVVSLDIPDEYKEKGFIKTVLTEDNKLDVNKMLKKMENQESLLGKRALPTKDSSADEVNEFIAKMSANFNDADFTDAMEGLDTFSASELKKTCHAMGMTPTQTKHLVETHKKLVEQKYSEDDFKKKLNDAIKTPERLELAKKVLGDEDWDKIKQNQNQAAVDMIEMAARIGEKYAVKEGTTGAGIVGTGADTAQETGFCQAYIDEMRAIDKRRGSMAEKEACMKKYKVLE